MLKFIFTTTFGILVITTLLFVLFTALPIFVQIVFVKEVNRRIWDFVFYGLPYLTVSLGIFVCWLQRRYMLIYRVQRIPRSSVIFKRDDAPSSVSNLVQIEYLRTCSIAHLSQPTTGYQPGWGSPGTRFSGINFKRSFLDTVDQIDSAARDILPSLPPLPHPFRLSAHLAPLLRILPEGAPLAHQIDSLLQIVFYAGEEDENEFFNLDASKTGYFASISHNNGYYKDENTDQRVSGEMTLQEYERGMKAAAELLDLLEDEKRALESDFSDHMSNTHSGAISRGSSARRRRASVAYDDEGQPISWRRRSRSDVYGIEKPDHQDARIPYASRSDEDFQFGR